jgi:sterol desaturase/sphingolipid hydroxylase (fatty acid hydroxylase superfamily)
MVLTAARSLLGPSLWLALAAGTAALLRLWHQGRVAPAWAQCGLMWTVTQDVSYVVAWAYYTYGYQNHVPPTLPRSRTVPVVAANLRNVALFNMAAAWLLDARINWEFSLSRAVAGLFVGLVVSACVAAHHYASHAIPYLRQHVHGVHHQAVVTKPSHCLYSHRVEAITGYQAPLVLACWLIDAHCYCTMAGIALAIRESVKGHMTIEGVASEHNQHHRVWTVNFGGYRYFVDRCIGTFRRATSYPIADGST